MITEQIGYELSFSYLKPNSVSDNFSFGQKIMSGAFFQSAAKLIFCVPLKKFDLESEWLNYNSTDNSKPQKLYARSYALGGLDLTVGLKYMLWSRGN